MRGFTPLFYHEQADREALFGIGPALLHAEARPRRQAYDVVGRKLVRRLGMNRLAGDEARFHSERVDRNRLPATRHQKRLHHPARDVVARDVVERIEIEMTAQLAIDAAQEILVERRRYAGR